MELARKRSETIDEYYYRVSRPVFNGFPSVVVLTTNATELLVTLDTTVPSWESDQRDIQQKCSNVVVDLCGGVKMEEMGKIVLVAAPPQAPATSFAAFADLDERPA